MITHINFIPRAGGWGLWTKRERGGVGGGVDSGSVLPCSLKNIYIFCLYGKSGEIITVRSENGKKST